MGEVKIPGKWGQHERAVGQAIGEVGVALKGLMEGEACEGARVFVCGGG